MVAVIGNLGEGNPPVKRSIRGVARRIRKGGSLVSRHAYFFLYSFLLLITEWFYFFRTLFF